MTSYHCIKLATFAVAGALTMSSPIPAAQQDPIKIAINEWTGQQLTAHILGGILSRSGFEVEYVVAGNTSQWTAMSGGTLNLQPEVWSNSSGEMYPKAVADGSVVKLGALGLDAREGWFYPPYMEEGCPGLPSYQALYKCASAFATSETFPNGRLIGYPADWGTQDPDQVKALELPFQVVSGGSEGTMIAEMRAAVASRQPILIRFWAPHWIHTEIPLHMVQWDYASPECQAGVGQSKGNACGFTQASVEKVVNKDFELKWPGALKIVKAFRFTNAEQEALILKVDQKGQSVEAVAEEWLKQNEQVWRPFTK